MANLKISQLPDYTGSTLGSWLIANNSSETETFKIERETFLNGYVPTTDLTALSSSIAATDLGQNNRLTTIEGRYATTGSNTFVGTETISGSVVIQGSGNTALNVNGGNSLFSGSIIINGSSAAGSKFLLFSNASGSVGASVVFIPSTIPSLSISAGAISGSVSIGTLQSGINTLFGDTRLTGSAHNITGSLGIRGNVQMTGSFTQTGSLVASGSAAAHRFFGNSFVATAAGASALNAFDVASGGLGNYLTVNGATGGNIFTAPNTDISSSVKTRIIGPTTEVSSSLKITGSLSNTGNFNQNGITITTGSVQGNVNALTVSSNTASLDLSQGNFFTLQLVSGSNVFVNPSNIVPGQTINVLVNTIGSGSITFANSVRQISGSLYVPTYATGQDILTMVSFGTSSLYLANAKNFL
jgi:hypothetical protein